MKRIIWLAAVLASLNLSQFTHAEIHTSGFASIVGGRTISGDGDQFLADYSSVGFYGDELTFQPESVVGIQFMADLEEGLRFTTQMVSRGLTSFNTEVDYAYLTYDLSPSWFVQAGRKRLPLQYYSEFFDVGFSYPWIRPPADLYTWQVLNYNGISVTNKMALGGSSLNTTFFTGREDSENNRLLSTFFYGEPVTEVWKNILGVRFDWNMDIYQLLLSYTTFDLDRFFTDPNTTETNVEDSEAKFYAASFNVDTGDWFVLTEWNKYDSDRFKTENWLASAGYRIGMVTPYLASSEFKEEPVTSGATFEEHTTQSAGIRYDFHPQAALKVQYDDVNDKGSLALAGDSQSVTVAVDLVF